MKKNYIVDAWLVIVLSLGFGSALAAVQIGLKPKIDANKLDDTLRQVPTLVAGATRGERVATGDRVVYRALNAEGQTAGWVLPAAGQGFADRIELLVGVDAAAEHVTGLYVLDQKETPGLGDFITKEKFRGQFAGKTAVRPLRVVKNATTNPEEIEAVTGATISSDATTHTVNEAIARFRAQPVNAPATEKQP
jgi:electron transport complex protein RnfG